MPAPTVNPMDMTGKRVLVTGASSGLGRATATLLSRLGANLILLARDEQRLAETLACLDGSGHSSYSFDLTQTDEIPSLLKRVAAEQGPIDGLFHSAGVVLVKTVQLAKRKDVDTVWLATAHASLLLARGFAQPSVRADRPTSIVFMSSVSGLIGSMGLSVYSASKGAMNAAARSLAVELAPKGIRVNTVLAASVLTEMMDDVLDRLSEEEIREYDRRHLLSFGRPDDIANAAAYLLSDASRWVTGTGLVVDGGYTCL